MLCRCRWNYLLRNKNHTIKMPFLLPAPDFTPRQLQEQRITGTCEVQICRSVGPWSMGIQHIEHSIQNAYCKAIQLSDHFVYIGSFRRLTLRSQQIADLTRASHREPIFHLVHRR